MIIGFLYKTTRAYVPAIITTFASRVYDWWYPLPPDILPFIRYVPMLQIFEPLHPLLMDSNKTPIHYLKKHLPPVLARIVLSYAFIKTEKARPLTIDDRIESFFDYPNNKLPDEQLQARLLHMLSLCVQRNDSKNIARIRFCLLYENQDHLLPSADQILCLMYRRNVSTEIFVMVATILKEVDRFALERFLWVSDLDRYDEIYQSLLDFTVSDERFEVFMDTLVYSIASQPRETRSKITCTLAQLGQYHRDDVHNDRYQKLMKLTYSQQTNK